MKSTAHPIRAQVFQTLGKYLRMDPERLHSEDSLRDDLGLDSLQTIELVYEVESAFDLQIPDEDFGQMRTIDDVVTYLAKRTSSHPKSKGSSPSRGALKTNSSATAAARPRNKRKT